MMVAIFASMVLALLAAHSPRRMPRRLAVAALLACLALAMAEFLYEIDSPVDGFRLPWLQAATAAGRPA